jgi:hypothetical protein
MIRTVELDDDKSGVLRQDSSRKRLHEPVAVVCVRPGLDPPELALHSGHISEYEQTVRQSQGMSRCTWWSGLLWAKLTVSQRVQVLDSFLLGNWTSDPQHTQGSCSLVGERDEHEGMGGEGCCVQHTRHLTRGLQSTSAESNSIESKWMHLGHWVLRLGSDVRATPIRVRHTGHSMLSREKIKSTNPPRMLKPYRTSRGVLRRCLLGEEPMGAWLRYVALVPCRRSQECLNCLLCAIKRKTPFCVVWRPLQDERHTRPCSRTRARQHA